MSYKKMDQVEQDIPGVKTYFVDCIKCNEVKEIYDYSASKICLDCGEENYITLSSD